MGQESRRIMVTGGAGFIGSALIRHLIDKTPHWVLNVDKLTYAGYLPSLDPVKDSSRYRFERADIGDEEVMERLIGEFRPDAVMNLAAESHVDRSIDGAAPFIDTNVVGTFRLLESVRSYWESLPETGRDRFRFLHVSTDEVFGSLGAKGRFVEGTPYSPRSPYSASKAAADHLSRAWFHTYGLPVLVTNCSNNYGPCQFPEKLIPLVIIHAMEGWPISVYGSGLQIRDWLHVDDHVRALLAVMESGVPGESYNIGGNCEWSNIDLVTHICGVMDQLAPLPLGESRSKLIVHVEDRPGHDFRYAIDSEKIRHELGWRPLVPFDVGIRETVRWYIEKGKWWKPLIEKCPDHRIGICNRRRECGEE